ncbi:MAG: YesL family protein [Lachnospiraceae bacterium]|nr:YesL family protein [Lachnospiraceae bacterium]
MVTSLEYSEGELSEFLRGFLDSDSPFGKFMTKCWMIIGSNLFFVIISIPIVTIGAGFAGLYYTMFRTLRENADGSLGPFKEFWKGFRMNFKQATIAWIAFLIIALVGVIDYQICLKIGGIIGAFRFAILSIELIAVILFSYLIPVMTVFSDTLPHLIRNAFYFALHRPLKLIVILFFNIFPLFLTIIDVQSRPLYAFCWCFFGFGSIAMLGASLLYKDFLVFLPKDSEEGAEGSDMDWEKEAVQLDLRKLDGM